MRAIILVLLICFSFSVAAERLTIPPENIVLLVKKHSYKIFPTAIDTLAIIRVESNFKQDAVNPEISKLNPKRKTTQSNGLMQVQGGPLNIEENIIAGTTQLNEYYYLLDNNVEATVKSYNIGIGSYWKGQKTISAADYWAKFRKRRSEYIKYYQEIGDPYNILPQNYKKL